jgi:hypothetical protein
MLSNSMPTPEKLMLSQVPGCHLPYHKWEGFIDTLKPALVNNRCFFRKITGVPAILKLS